MQPEPRPTTSSSAECERCGMPHDITQTILCHAAQIAAERNAQAILVCGGNIPAERLVEFQSAVKTILLLTCPSHPDDSLSTPPVICVPNMPPTRMSQVRMGILLALSRGLLQPRDRVVCVVGVPDSQLLDALVVMSVGDEFDMFVGPTGTEWESSDLRPDVLQRVLELAAELALEGREGHAIGALFVIGDLPNVFPKTHQMVLNPFHGYPPERRNILDREQVGETAKEFSTIDGAFLIEGDGTIESVGTHIDSALLMNEHLPPGLGARHRAGAAITAATEAIAVVLSQSTGTVTVFRKGRIVAEIPKSTAAQDRPQRIARAEEQIVVVGGGITGLSIAWRLAQAGLAATVLEAGALGSGVTTRNQGWLRSGALIAPVQPRLALLTHASLKRTLEICPECVEPGTSQMLYLFTRPETRIGNWTAAWQSCGIPYELLTSDELARELPGLALRRILAAFRLPDRSIRFDVLLNRLALEARQAGVEIRTQSAVISLLEAGDRVRAVRTSANDEIPARFVVLAADAATEGLLRTLASQPREPAAEPFWTEPAWAERFAMVKSHLVAMRPGIGGTPFCIADRGGFNQLPHGGVSVFHANHWQPTADHDDRAVAQEEIARIREFLGELFPGHVQAASGSVEWASTTVRTISAEEPVGGHESLPAVTAHEPWRNLVSAIAGRATRWPAVAEQAVQMVAGKLIAAQSTRPPWLDL